MMPKPNLDKAGLTPWERQIADGILLKNGNMRASDPKPPSMLYRPKPNAQHSWEREYYYKDDNDRMKAYSSFVWRDVAFSVSTNPQHWCMPVCNDFKLETENKREVMKTLQNITDKIISTIPKEQWYGINRWGRVLGKIG